MNMHLHCWKERLKVCKLTKLKCAKSAPNFPDVCMVEEGRGGGGPNLPPSYKRDFAELYHRQITFKLIIFTNCGGRAGAF